MLSYRRLVCRVAGHRWRIAAFGLERRCSRCGLLQLADLLRGGWVSLRLPRRPRA